jgi:DNA-binding MarR family transcriptional regulator
MSRRAEDEPETLAELYRRPGFLLRRAHQIAVSLFLEECRRHELTATQYGVLVILNERPAIDQITLGRLLGLDRSTTGLVVRKLEERGLLGRSVGSDLRRRQLRLTPSGTRLLRRAAADATRAQARLLSPLSGPARERFLSMLEELALAFNDSTRVPVDRAAADERAERISPSPSRAGTPP